MARVYALSIHADYRCRHSGACCATSWDVPVETPLYRTLTEAVEGGRLHPSSAAAEGPFITGPEMPEGASAILRRNPRGECVFFEHDSHLCVVHRDLGEAALPSTCRHVPRIALRDPRGTFITLSHFCPTAAAMLFRDDVALEIVESPAAFPDLDYEGLTALDSWPPLLHPRMLMDLEGYAAWERHMIARCADEESSPEDVVATLERDARLLCEWTPGGATLAEMIADLPPAAFALRASAPGEGGSHPLHASHTLNVASGFSRKWHEPMKRYLAAKAFASWVAYQGRGLMAIVRSLDAALAAVRNAAAERCDRARRPLDCDLLLEAFRDADYELCHLADRQKLADSWSVGR